MTDEGCPCEVVFSFPKQSQKLLSRNRIASLRSQRRRKRPSDCFGPLALAMTGEKSLRASFVRLAKQSHFSPFRWSLRARLFVCEAISEIPRRFAARNDRSKESLRGRLFVSEAVSPPRSHCDPRSFVWRSNLRLLRFARNGEKCRRIASLRSQRRKMPPDCFASLAVTKRETASSLRSSQ
jgi:hypothetical protein